MPSNRFLGPSESVTIRSPTSNAKANGNIINPPRFAELGGLSSARPGGIGVNEFAVKPPGLTQRKMPNKRGENS